tara:strand:+ start:243 stop:497 length:255 start_codon:yes stop_codon:yes gene_type:complete
MSYLSNNINEMSMDSLLYGFQQRLQILVKENARKHMMDAQPEWVMDIIENEIQPLIDQIVDWEPSDDEITANNSCGTPWHDGCR